MTSQNSSYVVPHPITDVQHQTRKKICQDLISCVDENPTFCITSSLMIRYGVSYAICKPRVSQLHGKHQHLHKRCNVSRISLKDTFLTAVVSYIRNSFPSEQWGMIFQVLHYLWEAICQKWQDMCAMNSRMSLHDSTLAYHSILIQHKLVKHITTLSSHLPYSPNTQTSPLCTFFCFHY